VLITAREEVCL